MTTKEAIEQLEHSIELWYEFWCGASYHISEKDIEAIETLIKLAKEK